MELREQASNWVDPENQSEHKIWTRHDRSKADGDLGQHTSVIWKGVKNAMGLNRTWKPDTRMGTTWKKTLYGSRMGPMYTSSSSTGLEMKVVSTPLANTGH